jgi:PAS domain S-box-containing protein/putative nucleotidyltransferase with HDIG domain
MKQGHSDAVRRAPGDASAAAAGGTSAFGSAIPLCEGSEACRYLLEHSGDIILILNKLGRILYSNHSAQAGFGYSESELLGQSISRFLTRKSVTKAFFALAQEFLGHPQPELELEVRSKSGEVRLISVAESSAPIRQNGTMLGIMIAARDITDQRRVDLELKKSERRYRDLWENAPVAYHIMDRAGVITDANHTEAQMLGYAKEEIIGRRVFELMPPEQRDEAEERFRKKISGQLPMKSRDRIFLRKDGSKVQVVADDTLERDGQGHVTGIRSTLVDITKLKESEKALRKSEEQFRDVVEKSGIAIVIDDRDGRVTYHNARFAEILGYSAEEMKGRTIWTIVHPEDAATLRKYHEGRVRGENAPSRYDMRAIRKDGATIFLEVDVVAVEVGGRLVGTHSYIRDITEYKRGEEKRRETEARFRAIAEYSPDTILILDDSYHIIYANPASAVLSGHSLEEIMGQDFRAFIEPESRGIAADLYLRLLRKEDVPQRYEYGIVRKDGQKRRVEVTSSLVAAEDGKFNVIAQVRDVTDQNAAEEALKASEEKFKILFEYAPDAYYLNDPKGNFLDVNIAAERLTGYKKEELVGKDFLSLGLLPAFQIPRAAALLAKSLAGRPTGPDGFVLRRKDHTEVSAEIRTYPVNIKGQTLVLGIARDVTERKKAEERLRESQREVAFLAGLIECSDQPFAISYPDGRIGRCNSAFLRLTGYSRAQLAETNWAKNLTPPEWLSAEMEKLAELHRTGKPIRYEKEYILKDGRRVPVELFVHLARNENGEPAYYYSFITDITERQKAKEQLEESYSKLKRSMEGVIQAVALTVDMRDPYTSDHQRKVARLATAIAAEMKISPEQIEAIRIASLLHDMGKLAVPSEILNKPGRLDKEELQLIREHPKTGFDILSKIDLPDKIAQIVYQHHERMNGSGYPRGLAGQEILLEARILSVAEAVEAMTTHRPYRPAFSLTEALAQINRDKDFLYDPDVVEACLAVFTRNGFELKLAELRP